MTQDKQLARDEHGKIVADQRIKGWAPYYQNAVIRYLNLWEELFEKALEQSEFEFICVLLRNRGTEESGWDSFENTIEAIEGVYKATRAVGGNKRINLLLWAYGQITEASDHYEIIANMVNVAGGERYKAWNFPKKRIGRRGGADVYREQSPVEKLQHIKSECAKFDLPDYSVPFSEILDKHLRNAVYHSDYSVYEGMVRYKDGPHGFPTEYSEQQTNKLVNEALALHEVIKQLWLQNIARYKEPKVIEVSPDFSKNFPMQAQIIVREGHGVIALQHHPAFAGGFMFGIFQPEDKELIRRGVYKVPQSAGQRINLVLERMHQYKARRWGRFIREFHYTDSSSSVTQSNNLIIARSILGHESLAITDKALIKLSIDINYIADYLEQTY